MIIEFPADNTDLIERCKENKYTTLRVPQGVEKGVCYKNSHTHTRTYIHIHTLFTVTVWYACMYVIDYKYTSAAPAGRREDVNNKRGGRGKWLYTSVHITCTSQHLQITGTV